MSGLITANLASATFSTNNAIGAVNITGQITGSQGLVLDGTFGTGMIVTLTNTGTANNYRGNTVIGANAAALVGAITLTLGAANQIPNGTTAGNVVLNASASVVPRLNLGGFSETINGLISTGTANIGIVDGVSGTPTLTLGDNNATATFSGKLQNTTGTLSVTKIGSGTQSFTGTNTYVGTTTVSAGQLAVTGAGTLASGAGLSVAGGAVFTFAPTTPATLTEATVTLNGGSTVNLNYAAAVVGRISSTGVSGNTGVINLGLSGASITTGSYTLLSASIGLTAGGATYNIFNPTNFTYTTTLSDTAVVLNATTATAITTAFWLGGLAGNPTVWAASNGTTNSNWTTDAAGTLITPLVPGSTAAVTFSATGSVNETGMTLGANMSVASLTFNSANPVNTLNDGNTLAIAGAAGITMAVGSNTVSLGNNFILGIAQTWTNNSTANPLAVDGRVDTNALVLTLTGPVNSNINISGVVTGSGGITKTGAGTATLSAANAYTGATTIGDATAATNSTLTFSADQGILGSLSIGLIAAPTAATGTASLNVGTATFGLFSATTFSATANVVTIGAGKTLTFTGGMTIGINENTALVSKPTSVTFTGGSLVVTGGSIQVGVGQTTSSAANNSVGTLNLSGLTSFSFAGTNFNVGQGTTDQGNVTLANTNNATNSIIATLLTVGDSAGANAVGANTLTLGAGTAGNGVTNIIQTDTINISFSKAVGTLSFASQTAGSPGTVTITNRAGTGGVAINVGFSNTGTATVAVGTLDLRGHTATVLASTMTIGNTAIANTGAFSGTVSFDTGTFNATTLNLGLKSAVHTGTTTNTGTLNVGGGISPSAARRHSPNTPRQERQLRESRGPSISPPVPSRQERSSERRKRVRTTHRSQPRTSTSAAERSPFSVASSRWQRKRPPVAPQVRWPSPARVQSLRTPTSPTAAVRQRPPSA